MKQLKRYGKTAIAGILAAALLAGCAGEEPRETAPEEATLKEEYREQPTTEYVPSQRVSGLAEVKAPTTCDLSVSTNSYEGKMDFSLTVEVPEIDRVNLLRTRIVKFDNAFLKRVADNVADNVQWTWEGTPETFQNDVYDVQEGETSEMAEAVGETGKDGCRLEAVNHLGANGECAAMIEYLRYPKTITLEGEETEVSGSDYEEITNTEALEMLLRGGLQEIYEEREPAVTEPEAAKQAEAFLKTIGISNVQMMSVTEAAQRINQFIPDEYSTPEKLSGTEKAVDLRRGWLVRFSYVTDGIPISTLRPNALMKSELEKIEKEEKEKEEKLLEQMAAEKGVSVSDLKLPEEFTWDDVMFPNELLVIVGDEGIMQFRCCSQLEYEEATRVETDLIPWEELVRVVEQKGRYLYQLGDKMKYNVPTNVRFGYMVSETEDSQYDLIPVWDFYNREDPQVALLTINAADGTSLIRPKQRGD